MSVKEDSAHQEMIVKNTGESALLVVGVWTIGKTMSPSHHGAALDTLKARLPGLSACTTLRLPTDELRSEARVVTEPYDPARQQQAESFGPPRDVAIQDVFVTLQAPSGRWYTVSEGGAIDNLSPTARAHDGTQDESRLLFEMMGETDVLDVVGDTVAEEVDVERQLVAEVEADTDILEGVPRALASYESNGCA